MGNQKRECSRKGDEDREKDREEKCERETERWYVKCQTLLNVVILYHNGKRTTSVMGTESRTRRVIVCKVLTLLNVVIYTSIRGERLPLYVLCHRLVVVKLRYVECQTILNIRLHYIEYSTDPHQTLIVRSNITLINSENLGEFIQLDNRQVSDKTLMKI